MGKFFLGVIVGAAVMYTSLHYHIVRANDGLHLVPKLTSTFADSYVDIRGFGFQEVQEHPALVTAITQAGKAHLLGGAFPETIRDGINGVLDGFNPR